MNPGFDLTQAERSWVEIRPIAEVPGVPGMNNNLRQESIDEQIARQLQASEQEEVERQLASARERDRIRTRQQREAQR